MRACDLAAVDLPSRHACAPRRGGNAGRGYCHALYRPPAALPTMDVTLASAFGVVREEALVSARRILANVFFRSVLKLAVYRKDGSRIDFMEPQEVRSGRMACGFSVPLDGHHHDTGPLPEGLCGRGHTGCGPRLTPPELCPVPHIKAQIV